MIGLPEELHYPENEGFWEFEEGSGRLIANPAAPEGLKKAIAEWRAEIEEANKIQEDGSIIQI